jgi:hypothetical protein
MILVIAMFGSPLAHRWWQERQQPTPAAERASTPAHHALARPTDPRPQVVRPAPEVYPPPTTVTRQVTKCVVNGTIAYSAASDCATGGRTIAVDPTRSEIDGGFSEYQLEMLRSADARIRRQEVEAQLALPAPAAAMSTRNAECAALDAHIRALDDRARQAISGHEQDAIRVERARARSRQFDLHC